MTTPILDLDANDSSGATGNGYVTTFTENGPAVAVADIDVLITNSSGTIYNAVISGGRGQFDSLAVNGPLPDGITANDNGSALILSKAGGASPAGFQAALQKRSDPVRIIASVGSTAPDCRRDRSLAARRLSCASPAVSATRTGRPFVSTTAWILLVNPSRDRPIDCLVFRVTQAPC